ncbi:MAG TPA: TIGR03086 family metal-binding protein [Frankiaceae bacterium]|jgi:uncharacterized protein (TIGR03086 family)|nr:TIGR03086 family metal-binding protein [Frankiaceae bacterium]
MSDVDVLESVVAKGKGIVAGVSPDRYGAPTPCTDYDVKTLLDHIVGWTRAFAAGANGRDATEDPSTYTTDDPTAAYGAAADDLVRGWREHGTDRDVRFATAEMPGEAVLGMTLIEHVTHLCDLAIATGQEVPFTDEEVETALARAKASLPDEFRGEGKMFADVVPVPEDAPAVDRLLGFMGRQPA